MALKTTEIVPNDKGCDEVSTKPMAKSKAAHPETAPGQGESNMASGEMPHTEIKYDAFKKDEQGPDA